MSNRPQERPIIMGAESVRAILDGAKTETRRVVKPQPPEGQAWDNLGDGESLYDHLTGKAIRCPYGAPGDRLWVREAHAIVPRTAYAMSAGVQQTINPDDPDMAAVYRAGWERSGPGRWRPSIHMPRWASRITLEVTGVRVERVQEIDEADVQREGVTLNPREPVSGWPSYDPIADFRDLWNEINAKRGFPWDANPWVWVVSFRAPPEGEEGGG